MSLKIPTKQPCAKLREEFYFREACNHQKKEVVKKVIRGGNFQVFEQCQMCGSKVSKNLPQKKYNLADLPNFNEEREAIFQGEMEERCHLYVLNAQAKRQSIFDVEHGEYIQSKEWKEKAALVLKRDGFLCQACLTQPAAHVHHLTYANLGDEPLFELVSVCESCHAKIHDKETRRNTSGH